MSRVWTFLWKCRASVFWSCLAGAVFLILPAGFWLQRWSFDLLTAARPARVVSEVVIVYIDDLSHTRLNQPYDAPWDRRLTARLLDRLRSAGASVVGFDVLMVEEGRDPAADAELAEAIRSHGNVVLGATLSRGDYFGLASEIQLKLPITNLLAAAQGWGVVELRIDPDDTVRRLYIGSEDMRSLSWRMAEVLSTRGGVRENGARALDPWLNHYGPDGGIPSVSLYKVLDLDSPLPDGFFRGKAVLVGAGSKSGYSGKRKDQFRNPYTWLTGRYSPGVEIHAVSVLNLLRGDMLTRFPWFLELGGILLTSLAFSIAVRTGRSASAVWRSLAVAGSVFIVAWILVAGLGVWTPWLIPVLIQGPVVFLIRPRESKVTASSGQETREFFPTQSGAQSKPVIPDYEMLHLIGRGAYGEVWRARTITGEERAVKLVWRSRFHDGRAFDREFEGLKHFEPLSRSHPGFVQVLHVGRAEEAGMFYYVMELADDFGSGEQRGDYVPHTLASPPDPMKKGDPLECLRVARFLCDALECLHGHGLVHRDIKPQNIVFVNGRPKLADVGLVSGIGVGASLVGTDGYLPPEGPGTVQADIFALGRTLYVMLTGQGAGDFPLGLGKGCSAADGQKIRTRLETVVRRACHSDARARFVSASAMRAALPDM